eukprot:scaffold4829_cov129-Cylindrotheca_fusiformis.AAC.28
MGRKIKPNHTGADLVVQHPFDHLLVPQIGCNVIPFHLVKLCEYQDHVSKLIASHFFCSKLYVTTT